MMCLEKIIEINKKAIEREKENIEKLLKKYKGKDYEN
jgi:hypothetical protein